MDASAFADLLKPFPLLQLLVGGAVFLAVIAVTLRGVKENRRDAHIAPPGYDPFGFTVFANQVVTYLSLMVEHGRQTLALVHTLHAEQVKTNARLSELQTSHASEMDRLRETVEDASSGRTDRRR